MGHSDAHSELLFQAEVAVNERRQKLGVAMQKAKVDLGVRDLLLWVFNVTKGGRDDVAPLVKTHSELGYRPWGLCCSQRTAQRIVAKAEDLGLLKVIPNQYTTGGTCANGYRIDWNGIDGRWLNCPPDQSHIVDPGTSAGPPIVEGFGSGNSELPRGQNGIPHGQSGTPPSQIDYPPSQNGHVPNKNSSSCFPEPGSRKEPRPGPICADWVLKDFPEVAEAMQRHVATKELKFVENGAVWRFFTDDRLKQTEAVVRWFQEQGATTSPVFPMRTGWLVLVLAASMHSTECPSREIKKTRVTYFINTCSKGHWRRCAHWIRRAHQRLQEPVGSNAPFVVTHGGIECP